MWRFDWLDCMVKNSGGPLFAVRFDSNATEMTTAEHYMSLMKFCVYKSWSLHDSNSTTTGACITQNQKDWRSCMLNHKHSHSPCIGSGRPATTFEFSEIYYVLKTMTNVAAVVCRVLHQLRLF